MKAARLCVIVALCLGTTGCWFGKKAAPKPPPPPVAQQPALQPQPVPVPAPVPEPVVEPLPLSPRSSVQTLEPVKVPEPPPTAAPKATPPARPAARRSPFPPAAPPAAAPAPAVPVSPQPAPAPAPQLREIIAGDRRRQLEAEYAQALTRANAVLQKASGRALNAGQKETVARIRTFLTQAAAAREGDISTALQLSRRADLLAQELGKSLN